MPQTNGALELSKFQRSHIGKDVNLISALLCASEEGNVSGLTELSDTSNKINFSSTNRNGETALHMAASEGHVDVLSFLQDKGVNVNVKDKQGDTALYWAARQGQLKATKWLLEAGVFVDSQNKSGETALHVAARYGHSQVVDYLCEADATINMIDILGETPLHNAAWHGYLEIVRTLCNYGAVPYVQNKDGETVLHCSASRGNLACVRILLDSGAPLNYTDKRGCTALLLACQRRHTQIAHMLLHAGAHMDIVDKEVGESCLHAACREGLQSVVQTMCTMGCQVDTVNDDGLIPLHLAIKSGHIEIIRCLLLFGANPKTMNKDGLMGDVIALAQGYLEIANLMIRVKADRNKHFVQQLGESVHCLPRVKLKVLGSSGVGKSLLIETLKCGLLGGFFRSRLSVTSTPHIVKRKLSRQLSLPSPLSYCVDNVSYTKGIDIHQTTIPGSGQFSVWDFSGYEPYFVFYDHFLGDTNCIHVIVFSLLDSPDEQAAQVVFWLNFLRARILPAMPLGYCGQLMTTPQVILAATHADKVGCLHNSQGEYVHEGAFALHSRVQLMFQYDISISNRLHLVDARLANSADIKLLRRALSCKKCKIVANVTRATGLLEATVVQIPLWRERNQTYPSFTWAQFIDSVRSKVNPLASDSHIQLLVQQLQLIGEVIYVENSKGPDEIVLWPQWLTGDIIGALMSHDTLAKIRVTGSVSLDEFQLMFPDYDPLCLLQLLEALEVCTQCQVDGDVEYEFPAMNFVIGASSLWHNEDNGRHADAVYGGMRLYTDCQFGSQFKYIFPRIQVCLRRSMLREDEERCVDFCQWHHGSKYCWGEMEGLVDIEKDGQYLEVKVRGPPNERYALFFFLQDFLYIIEQLYCRCEIQGLFGMHHNLCDIKYFDLLQVVCNVCPGQCLERYTLSPTLLRQHGAVVRSYSPTEMLGMQLEKRTSILLSGTTQEHFLDIACMGSTEVLPHLVLGLDLDISQMTIHTQRLLSMLLDPVDPMGQDWCLLAVVVGLSDYLPHLDNDDARHSSKTYLLLIELSRRRSLTLRQLLEHLGELNRIDAIEAILRSTAPFRVVAYEEQSVDVNCVSVANDASTNTLSNLSR